MTEGDEPVDLTQRDNDALAEMYKDFQTRGKAAGTGRIQSGPDVGDYLIAVITSITGVAIGYYKLDLYQHDPLLSDIQVRMSSAKLGISNRSKLPTDGYGYNWDDATSTAHTLDVGQIFECQVKSVYGGEAGDGKPIVRLFGNPINVVCTE